MILRIVLSPRGHHSRAVNEPSQAEHYCSSLSRKLNELQNVFKLDLFISLFDLKQALIGPSSSTLVFYAVQERCKLIEMSLSKFEINSCSSFGLLR